IVPNSKLSSSTIVNYSNPTAACTVFYEIGVSYDADIDKVEKTILDVIRKVAKTNNYLIEGTEWTRLDRFGDFALVFRFGYQVSGYVNRFSVLRDVNRELFKEFKNKKIEIPFPIRVIKKG
ncbi:MAG: mechanosensitive ion channel family protein, partial [Candidatus Bilamarchaeaceae archaeon]